MVDRSDYIGGAFMRFDDLVDGLRRKVIVAVEDGQFGKPVLVFDDGTRLSLNKANARLLSQAYGNDDEAWIGQRIELYQGKAKDNQGVEKDSIRIRLLGTSAAAKQPPRSDDPSDEIPWR